MRLLTTIIATAMLTHPGRQHVLTVRRPTTAAKVQTPVSPATRTRLTLAVFRASTRTQRSRMGRSATASCNAKPVTDPR